MFGSPDMRGNARGAFQFDPVALAIVDGQGEQAIAGLARECRRDERV